MALVFNGAFSSLALFKTCSASNAFSSSEDNVKNESGNSTVSIKKN